MAQNLNLNTNKGTLVSMTEAEAKRVRQVYKNAAADIEYRAKHLPQVNSAPLQEAYLKELLNQVNTELNKIDGELQDGILSSMYAASDAYVHQSLDFLQAIGMPIGGAYSHVPDDVVRSIASGKIYSDKWSLSTALWKNHMKVQSDVQKVVAQGVAENKSVYDIAKDLEKYVNPDARKAWDWSKVYPGTARKVDYNAQRLARTMISHAYQQSFVRSTQKNPFVTKYQWEASNSERVCEICEERDGQLYDKDDLPLDHPNGMCTYIAVMPDNLEEIADKLADWAHGEANPDIDAWVCDLYNCDAKYGDQQLQAEWLTKYGFDPNNPPDFDTWLSAISFDDLAAILDITGDAPLEQWYAENLLSGSVSFVFKDAPIAPITKGNLRDSIIQNRAIPDKSTWISLLQKQTEANMLQIEQDLWVDLSQEQRIAIRRYTGNGYNDMNLYLRSIAAGKDPKTIGVSPDRIEQTKLIQQALSSHKLASDVVLRRGSSYSDLAGLLPGDRVSNKEWLKQLSVEDLNGIFAGGTFEYSSFTSTSSIWEKGFTGSVETIIYAPAGTEAASIMTLSGFGTDEGETLINSNQAMRIVSIEESDGHKQSQIRVFVELLS